jgi:hypothetical protein
LGIWAACAALWVPFSISIYRAFVSEDEIERRRVADLLLEYLLLELMQLLQLLDFDLLLPQEVGVAIVLEGKSLLLVGGGQRFRDVLGTLERLAIEKVRISALLRVVLEEGGDEVLLAHLVCVHGWDRGDRGDDHGGLMLVVNGGRTAKVPAVNPVRKRKNIQNGRTHLRQQIPPPPPSSPPGLNS